MNKEEKLCRELVDTIRGNMPARLAEAIPVVERALAKILAAPSSPPPVEGELARLRTSLDALGYHKVFTAITEAVEWGDDRRLGISVEKLLVSLTGISKDEALATRTDPAAFTSVEDMSSEYRRGWEEGIRYQAAQPSPLSPDKLAELREDLIKFGHTDEFEGIVERDDLSMFGFWKACVEAALLALAAERIER